MASQAISTASLLLGISRPNHHYPTSYFALAVMVGGVCCREYFRPAATHKGKV